MEARSIGSVRSWLMISERIVARRPKPRSVEFPLDVRLGSLADITARSRHVRFTPPRTDILSVCINVC